MLRLWSRFAVLSALALACTTTACGGPSQNSPAPAGGHLDTLRALRDTYDTLPDDDSLMPQMLAYAATLPDVVEPELVDDGETLVAVFTDGSPLVVTNNRSLSMSAGPSAPSPSTHPAMGAPPPTGVFRSDKVTVFNSMGDAFVDPTPALQKVFAAGRYTVATGSGSVEDLRDPGNTSDAAVFYYDGHGASFKRKTASGATERAFAMWTSTCVSDTTPGPTAIDEEQGRLIEVVARNRKGAPPDGCESGKNKGTEVHYAITPDFVRQYMTFANADSFAYVDTCQSASAGAATFRQAMFDKGLALYFGWTKNADDDVWVVAPYLFDRMAGANVFDPQEYPDYEKESPPQRPFSWEAILANMSQRGLDLSPHTKARLVSTPNERLDQQVMVGQLAPSLLGAGVGCADPSCKKGLSVGGNFGDALGAGVDPADAVITLAGTPLACTPGNDSSGDFLCDLGNGPYAGPLVLMTHGRPSNPLTVTEWKGAVHIEIANSNYLPAATTTDVFDIDLHLAQWVEQVRIGPHGEMIHLGSGTQLNPMPDSTVTYNASGTYQSGQGSCTHQRNPMVPETLPLSAWGSAAIGINWTAGDPAQFTIALSKLQGSSETCANGWNVPGDVSFDISQYGTYTVSYDDATGAVSAPIFARTGNDDISVTVSVRDLMPSSPPNPATPK